MTPQAQFDALCIQATNLLNEAAKIASLNRLSDIDRCKAQAAAGLAGVTFHKISVHGADPSDLQSVEDDLLHIARKVEPLISEIGAQAVANSTARLDQVEFEEVIQTGLENAISDLRQAAQRLADEESYRSDFEEHNTHSFAFSGVR